MAPWVGCREDRDNQDLMAQNVMLLIGSMTSINMAKDGVGRLQSR